MRNNGESERKIEENASCNLNEEISNEIWRENLKAI